MAQQSQLLYFLTSYIYIVHDPAVFLITRVFIQKRGCVLSASQAVKGKYVTFMCRTDWRRKLTCDLSAPDTRGGQWKTSVDPGVDGPLGECLFQIRMYRSVSIKLQELKSQTPADVKAAHTHNNNTRLTADTHTDQPTSLPFYMWTLAKILCVCVFEKNVCVDSFSYI